MVIVLVTFVVTLSVTVTFCCGADPALSNLVITHRRWSSWPTSFPIDTAPDSAIETLRPYCCRRPWTSQPSALLCGHTLASETLNSDSVQETVDLTAERIFEVLSACGMAHALPLSFAAVFNVSAAASLVHSDAEAQML